MKTFPLEAYIQGFRRLRLRNIHDCRLITKRNKDCKVQINSHAKCLDSSLPLVAITGIVNAEPSCTRHSLSCKSCSLVYFHHSLFYWKSQTLCGKSLPFPRGAIFGNHNFSLSFHPLYEMALPGFR